MTSTSVATNGADEVAGSKPSRRSSNGSSEPTSVPHSTTPTSASADRQRDQQPVLAVDVGERRPDGDAQEADRRRGCAPSARPATISRRITRHQSRSVDLAERQRADDQRRRLRAGVAAARDDQRHEQRQHDRLRDLRLEEAHRRRGQHFAEEQRRQPAGALLDHPREARSPCTARRGLPNRRCAGCPRVAAASATSSTSSMVTMPISTPAVSVTGSADAVVLAEHRDRGLPGRRSP